MGQSVPGRQGASIDFPGKPRGACSQSPPQHTHSPQQFYGAEGIDRHTGEQCLREAGVE